MGKTTLMLQYIKLNYPPGSRIALYCTLDSIYFSNHTLLELAEKFYLQGGKHLFLDEVHKYPTWSKELKEIYDLFYDMLPNCKRIRTCNRRISYIDDDPEYLSNDMTTYYSRALMAIMNNDEKLLNKLYKEQNIKAYIGGDKFS